MELMIETARLRLEPWQSSDWPAFQPIAQDVDVMRYITGGIPWTDERIRDFVGRQMKLYAERQFCRWKLLERESGALIGFCGAGTWRDAADMEIGWWLARRCWGRGLATEAARAALRDIFERVGLERVISVAMVGNAASIRVMEKLGLRFERQFENEGFSLVQYAISRGEYSPRMQS